MAELSATELVQACVVCGAQNRLPLATLRVGLGEGEERRTSTVALPPCASCGASEFLLRSPEGEPPHPAPGSPGHLHRLLVDHLYGRLALAEGGDGGGPGRPRPGPSDEELRRWFPGGLRMPPSKAEALRPTGPDDPLLRAIAAGKGRG
ncbi:MAG TPA: hypothetical protein VFS43_17730 [Polyangiaceae bacterium]|nr:hypothetical protein [Polyangiaceae bacterium]